MQWFRIAALVGASILFMVWMVVRPEQLYVQRIEFTGTDRATEAQLRHLSDVKNGSTIWEVDLRDVSERVREHPWVAAVRVERRLPGTIEVHVTEHKPVAVLAFDDGLFYVDEHGTAFARATSSDLDYPIVTGVGPELEAAHPDLPRWVIHDALWLIAELDDRDLVRREQISEVSFHRARGFAIHTSGSAQGFPTARVLVGLGDYERQLKHLAALLDKGVDLTEPLHVDVAPQRVAIVRPLSPTSDRRLP